MLDLNEAIVFSIESTADWRRRKAEEFPDDLRNLDAAEILERLAAEVLTLEGTDLHKRLIAGLDGDDGFFSAILSEMTRTVGFRSFPDSGENFVRELIGHLDLRSSPTPESVDDLASHMLLQTVIVAEPRGDAGRLVQAVALPWFDIVTLIQRDPNSAFEIPPDKWEEIIAGAYKNAGFDEVILTPRSGDFGRDIIAIKKGLGTVRIIDQVKAYRPPHLVTANDVRALWGVLQSDGAAKGFLTTTSDFAPKIRTDPFIALWIPSRLELVNGATLFERLGKIARSRPSRRDPL